MKIQQLLEDDDDYEFMVQFNPLVKHWASWFEAELKKSNLKYNKVRYIDHEYGYIGLKFVYLGDNREILNYSRKRGQFKAIIDKLINLATINDKTLVDIWDKRAYIYPHDPRSNRTEIITAHYGKLKDDLMSCEFFFTITPHNITEGEFIRV